MTYPVMTADKEGFQRTGIGISDCWMLSQSAELAQGRRADLQQAAHFARSVHRGRVDPGLVEELPELGFGQVQNLGVTLAPRNASKTAGERLYATHGITPLPHACPKGRTRLKTPTGPDSAFATRCNPLTPHPPPIGTAGCTMPRAAPAHPQRPAR